MTYNQSKGFFFSNILSLVARHSMNLANNTSPLAGRMRCSVCCSHTSPLHRRSAELVVVSAPVCRSSHPGPALSLPANKTHSKISDVFKIKKTFLKSILQAELKILEI